MESNNPLVPEYIIRKLILLYAFNLETLFKSKPVQNDSLINAIFENYYLINAEWINKYKDFYNYDKIIK